MVTSRGLWSDVVPSQEEREQLGNREQNSRLMKLLLSRRTRVGESRLLLQVYSLSSRGNSMRARSPMRPLKLLARDQLKFALFLSAGDRVRL